jgi:hypothetical protein
MSPSRGGSPGAGYAHDDTLWPVVVTMIPSRALDEELQAHMDYVDGLYARGEPFLTVTFIRLSTRTTNQQRAQMSAWMTRTEPAMKRLNRGAAFVTGSTAFRFVLSGLMLLSPLPIPYEVFTSARDATPWLERALREAGLAVPGRLGPDIEQLEARFARRDAAR